MNSETVLCVKYSNCSFIQIQLFTKLFVLRILINTELSKIIPAIKALILEIVLSKMAYKCFLVRALEICNYFKEAKVIVIKPKIAFYFSVNNRFRNLTTTK